MVVQSKDTLQNQMHDTLQFSFESVCNIIYEIGRGFLNIQPDNKKSHYNINFCHEGLRAKFIWE